MTTSLKRPKLLPPNGEKRVLLHTCCAPCSSEIIETLVLSGIDITIFFYNPNIHPREEYEHRKSEIIRFANKKNIPFVDADYDPDKWFNRIKGLEWELEGGKRCAQCFDLRFERTALFAAKNGFKVFTSSLGMSRWKDIRQIYQSGMRAATRYPGLVFWTHNWRKDGGLERRDATVKGEQFYRQQYCGCIFSLRDTNLRRAQSDKESAGNSKNTLPIGQTTPES